MILLIVLVGAYGYASVMAYDAVSVTAAKCDGRFAENTPAAFDTSPVDASAYLMPEFEDETIPSRDPGIALSAWFVPADDGNRGPAVIVVHGHNSCKREGRILLAAGMLHRHGVAVLLIDIRNHGDSSVPNGRFAGGTREYRDVLGAWDWLVAVQGFAPDHIGLYGQSLGAATVLIATGEEPRIAATWEDSSYADLDVAVQAELSRRNLPTLLRFGGYLVARLHGDDPTSLSPLGAIAKLHGRPIFITHGDADERLSVGYASDLAAAVRANGGTVEPWIVAGARHVEAILLRPAEYERRLDAFFDGALGAP
ncbi:MAG: alpha/beta fold hydrolase [Chloroflexota bacterium]